MNHTKISDIGSCWDDPDALPLSPGDGRRDVIPLESEFEAEGPDDAGASGCRFYAFNTVVTIKGFGEPALCRTAFSQALAHCRAYERLFSRTLPHSDIARINAAGDGEVAIHRATFRLLEAARFYCGESRGCFDITVGSLTGLWDFNTGAVPDSEKLVSRLTAVDWKALGLKTTGGSYSARLTNERAALDVGGIAKGYIADELVRLLESTGVTSFMINLGGNVLVNSRKPNGDTWKVGIQDPKDKAGILAAVGLVNGSAVTSGTYERSFVRDGRRYHHILNPKTGFPVETDVAGVTVITRRSIDAEGFSTTLLALGIEAGTDFARARPEILTAYFVDENGAITTA